MSRLRFLLQILLQILVATLGFPAAVTAGTPVVEWENTFGGPGDEEAFSVQQTRDGGFILGGYTASFSASNGDVYLVKLGADGNQEWSKTYGGTGLDTGFSALQTTDGGYIVVGWSASFGQGDNDVYMIKTDAQGEAQWARTYGSDGQDLGWSIEQTEDGGYIVAGHTWPYLSQECDILLIKTDDGGHLEWAKTHGGDAEDWALSIEQTVDGGFIIAGHTWSYGAGRNDAYLLKTDALGVEEWSKTFGGPSNDFAWSARATSSGGYILAGGAASFGESLSSVYVVKTDATGQTEWWQTYGGSEEDLAFHIEETTDRGYVIAGMSRSFGDLDGDIYLMKCDRDGVPEWRQTIGGDQEELGYAVAQTTDGGFVVAGSTTSSGAGGRDMYVARLVANPDAFQRGDANGDGVVDLSDALFTLNWLFAGGRPPPCLDAADADDTGHLQITDPIFHLGVLFLGGGKFPPPSQNCGTDPTPDSLGCFRGCM